jgi:ribosomal protein L25 (general stress protein Ctc)
MKNYKEKRVRKKNCSNVRIYEQGSDLVKFENNQRPKLIVVKKNSQPKILSELDLRNAIYKSTVQQIDALLFKCLISKVQRKILKRVVFKMHREQRLTKSSYSRVLNDIRNFRLIKLQKQLRS